MIVVCFDDDGQLTYVVKSVHPVEPSTQQPTWPAVLLGAELSAVQETQMEKGAREALIMSDWIATRGQTEGIRGCRERTQVSRLRIDGPDVPSVRAKRQAPRQREQKRTATQEKRRCVHCGKGFHVKGIWKHQESCKIEASSSSASDEVKLEPSRAAMKPGTSSGQSSGQAELLASLKEMLAKAQQSIPCRRWFMT